MRINTTMIMMITILAWLCYSMVFVTVGENWKEDKGHPRHESNETETRTVVQDVSSETVEKLKIAEKNMNHMECLKNVLWKELPIANGKDKGTNKDVVFAHHGDAGHWQIWNKAIASRFKGLKAMDRLASSEERCSVWEVGANVKAQDSMDLMKMYGNCKYHGFEPVADFSEKLEQLWKDENRFTVHKFGIGGKDETFAVSKESLQGSNGQSTFLGDAADATGDINITIKSFDYTLEQTDGVPSLLQMNCEGCEWTFLPEAFEHGWIKNVPIIQIGWHSYGDVGLGARAWQLCEIRQLLSETHSMDYGLAFGWERWSLKE